MYVNPGCLKCISSLNLSLAKKELFVVSFILYLQNIKGTTKWIWFKSAVISKLHNNPLASCSCANLDFLLPQKAVWCSHYSSVFYLYSFWVFTLSNSSTLQTIRQHCFIIELNLFINSSIFLCQTSIFCVH